MSVTLRDAQHLCWKSFRKINDKLDSERSKGWICNEVVTGLLEASAEVAAVAKLGDYEQAESTGTRERLARSFLSCSTRHLFWQSSMVLNWKMRLCRQ